MRRSAGFRLCFALLLVAASLIGSAALADDYPQRAVTLVVPLPPGGATDLFARLLAQELRDKLHQAFVIENRPGAGTTIAAAAVAKSPPDGYTLFLAPMSALAVSTALYKALPYDPVKDFAPIALVGQSEFVLIANPSLGAKTFSELIALIKSKPGELNYASAGPGSPHHIFMELLQRTAGLRMQHVPYRGGLTAVTAIVSGEIPLMIADVASALAMIKDGKVRTFAVPSQGRVAALPDVPTFAESGVTGFAAASWYSVVARAGTPRPAIDKLNAALTGYVARADVQERLAAMGIRPLTSTPEELERFIAAETVKWTRVVKDAGITPE
ncbi:MAG: Bug family tripartite tricarboxylate transporter substrate binding protein [Xanthobacteraceae bacterium]